MGIMEKKMETTIMGYICMEYLGYMVIGGSYYEYFCLGFTV